MEEKERLNVMTSRFAKTSTFTWQLLASVTLAVAVGIFLLWGCISWQSSVMELLDLFITSLIPVIKVLLVIAVGFFLAIERIDLLGTNARHHLNNMVFYVFFPALIACSLADTITVENLATLWFMPVNIFISCIIGSILGWILAKMTRTPPHLKGLIIACSSAANLGNMLLIILPAICEETNTPFGDSSTCTAYGEAYASLSLAIQAIYVWSILYFIMRKSASRENEESKANDSTVIVKTCEGTPEIESETCREPLLATNWSSGDSMYQVDFLRNSNEDVEKEKISSFGRMKLCFMSFVTSKSLKMIFAPSTIAAMIGFVIGIVSPIRKAVVGDSAPLHVIYSSVELIGEAGIPSLTLIVGANLLKGLKGESEVGAFHIMGIVVIRNIVLPLCGILVVKAAKYGGLVEFDPFYEFTLMLQYAIPPAMNIGTISQMVGTGESEFSVLMLWNYVASAFSLTLWTAFYMWLVT